MVGVAAVLEVAIHTDLIGVANHKARTVGRNLPEFVIYLCALEGSLGPTESAEAFTLVIEVEVTVHITDVFLALNADVVGERIGLGRGGEL